jgi:hypothetical protein
VSQETDTDDVTNGSNDPGMGLARTDGGNADRSPWLTVVVGITWCVLGGLLCGYALVLAGVCMGYGLIVLTKGRSRAWWAAGAAACVVSAVVACVFFSPNDLVSSLVACVVTCLVVALAAQGRMTLTLGAVLVGVVMAVLLGIDIAVPLMEGTDVLAVASQASSELASTLVSQMGVGYQSMASQLAQVMSVIWPVSYYLMALAFVAGSYLGAWLAGRRGTTEASTAAPVATFDMPRWPIVGLGVGIALVGASKVLTDQADVLLLLGVNLLLALRPLFAVQGLGVLSSLMGRWHLGCFLQVLLLFVAVDLELSFMVLSVFGLVDFWANFRHLDRGSGSEPKQIAE